MPDGQPIKGDYYFLLNDKTVTLVGLGFNRLIPGECRRSNGCVIGLLEDEYSLLGLHRYQAARYYCTPGSDVEILANSLPAFKHNVTK